MSLNKVMLIGNLGKDPEIRRLNNGGKVVSFPLATSESWKDKTTGERKERTEWHNVVLFNEALGDVVERFCQKGSKIYVEGKLQTRKWQDQTGADRWSTEVVLQVFDSKIELLDGKPKGDRTDDREQNRSAGPRPNAPIDDDIPF